MKTPLTYQYIKEFVNLLGADAKNCYYNLKETKPLKGFFIQDFYKDFYTKFETVPVLFLSFVDKDRTNTVYLWQMNRQCPYQNGTNHMVLDSRTAALNLKPHPSMLLLAKITPGDKEQILDATFFGEQKIVVKSISSDTNTMIWRLYKIKNFYPIAKINPYQQITVANDRFSYEIRLDFVKQAPQIRLELFKTKVDEEQVIDFTKNDSEVKTEKKKSIEVREIPSSELYQIHESSFTEKAEFSDYSCIVFLDKNTGSALLWREDYFHFSVFPEAANFNTMHQLNDKLYLINEKYDVFELATLNFETSLRKADITIDPFPVVENIIKQPRKAYEFYSNIYFPQIIYLNKSEIHTALLRKTEYLERKTLVDLEEHLKKCKSFNWSLCAGPDPNSYIIACVFNQYMYIYSVTPTEIFEKPIWSRVIELSTDNKETEYDIVASSTGKIYLSRELHHGSLQLIEVSYETSSIRTLFSHDYKLEVKEIQKSGQPFKKALEEDFFAQIDGEKGISFIRFDNEPFYVDTGNLVYVSPLSLINPQDTEASPEKKKVEKGDKNQDQDKKLFKKLEKTKVEISHNNNRASAMEESKEAMKDLRADISSKMKDVKKFDEEYKAYEKEKEKGKDKEKGKVLKEPVGVSKESIKLYQDLKTEKKKMDKQREKEKTQRKKER